MRVKTAQMNEPRYHVEVECSHQELHELINAFRYVKQILPDGDMPEVADTFIEAFGSAMITWPDRGEIFTTASEDNHE